MPKNNNTPKANNKRGTYRRFDGPIKLMRQSEIRGYAIRYLDNVSKNNGKCKYGFMAGLVREASSVNNVLQINSRAIEDEAARIVAEQRKVSPELSGTTKALDADDPWGDGLQVSVGINLLAHAAANPQPLPLVAVGNEVNEAAVVTTENYFLFRMGVTVVPRTVTRVRIHSLVEFIQFWYLGPGKWVHAFENCKSLIEVVLHKGVKTIGLRAFAGCSSLPRIIIPSSVTAIVQEAFCDCSTLVEVVLNNGLQRIGEGAFARCISLTRIDIPPSVTVIEIEAFLGCTNLVTVVLHEGLKRIGRSTFSGCRSLLHIDIPHSVTAIGDHAFRGCAIKILVGPYHNPLLLTRGYKTNEVSLAAMKKYYLYTPSFTTNEITLAANKGYYLYTDEHKCVPKTVTHVLIHRSVESIHYRAFAQCTALVKVVLHDGLRSIEKQAFVLCSSLTSIIIPPSVTQICDYAFRGCTALVKVVLYDGFLQRIGSSAFFECSSLSRIDIPPSVTQICDYAFRGCTALVEVVLHEGLNILGYRIFSECSPLLHLDIPSTVTCTPYLPSIQYIKKNDPKYNRTYVWLNGRLEIDLGFPAETEEYLNSWMMHRDLISHPNITDQEKASIMADTGIELMQLMNWLVINRKRYCKPRVEAAAAGTPTKQQVAGGGVQMGLSTTEH